MYFHALDTAFLSETEKKNKVFATNASHWGTDQGVWGIRNEIEKQWRRKFKLQTTLKDWKPKWTTDPFFFLYFLFQKIK